MAGRSSRSLVLDISANISQLDAGMKAARSVLHGFKGDVSILEAEVERAFADLGGNGAAASARQAEREFNKMFKSIAANAKAIKAETSQDLALQLFDVGAADEQVRALTMEAGAYRLAAQAAKQKALADGDVSEGTARMIAALHGQVVSLEQQALALDETATQFRSIQAQMGATDTVTRTSTQTTAQHRAGLQQLGYQLGDVATMYSLGMRPAQIFGSQIGQITQAVQMMSGGTSRFANFLGGPWGIALSVGMIALAPFVSKLWEGEEAAKAAEMGANGLATAQSALGQVFDLVSGKLKTQNELLMINARLTAINLRAEAQAKRAGAKDTLVEAQRAAAPGFFEAQTIGIQGLGKRPGERNADAVAALLRDVGAGKITREQALVRSESMDFSGTQATKAEFQAALRDAVVANLNDRAADLIDQSLDSGSLAPELRNPGREKRDRAERKPKDDSERLAREALQRERAFADQYHKAQGTILDAVLARAQGEDTRLALQLELLSADQDARDTAIDRQLADGELTDAEAEVLKETYRKADLIEEENLIAEARQRKLDEQLRVEQQQIDDQMALMRLQGQFAVTLEERRRIAQQLLALELEERRLAARRLLASDNPDDRRAGQAALAQIDSEEPYLRKQIEQDYADPLERHLERLREAAETTDEALMQVAANGLQSLEDALVGLITGTESVSEAFRKMAASILADLARIAARRAVLQLFSAVFPGAGGGGEPANLLAGTPYDSAATGGRISGGSIERYAAGGRMIRGPGSGTSDSILGLMDGRKPILVSNGESINTAAATDRYWPLIEAMNRGELPGFAGGGMLSPRMPRLPDLATLQPGGALLAAALAAAGGRGTFDGERLGRAELHVHGVRDVDGFRRSERQITRGLSRRLQKA